ncbi:MAG TPA: methyltransferase [Microbacteriaceae bacterium]|jgi:hypothetical protein|nr:methyltransferase [Microbacteriaceae bacterium]
MVSTGTTNETTTRAERTLTGKTWVAFGPAGAVGSIHSTEGGFTFKLIADADFRGEYPTIEVAKSALHASLLPGAEWPEFREH